VKAPKAIDIFSGCGGLTLGLKRAGFSVVGAIEIDELAAETYGTNHAEVHLWPKDVRKITAPQILRTIGLKRGELDLLAGCPPCQGFSAMRRLNGGRRVRDAQNDLVFDFLRLVKGLRPKAVMMENVPGLRDNVRFGKLKKSLERLGYVVNADVKDAQYYGVPQRRRRFILLAGLNKKIPFGRRARRKWTVREAFGQLGKRATRDPIHNVPERRSDAVAKKIRMIPKNGGSRFALGPAGQLKCHRMCDGFKDVYGRMAWDVVSPTITGGCCNPSKGRFLHPTKNRSITLREAALLQTFPRNYFFSLERGKFPAAEMIGNALPPEFIRRHAKQILRSLRTSERKHRC
jgi:DNA (cytosine-5)-methyltransferase 1